MVSERLRGGGGGGSSSRGSGGGVASFVNAPSCDKQIYNTRFSVQKNFCF